MFQREQFLSAEEGYWEEIVRVGKTKVNKRLKSLTENKEIFTKGQVES